MALAVGEESGVLDAMLIKVADTFEADTQTTMDRLLAALVRLGGLTQMVSRPVLRGFAFGVAATVILRQWPQMVGVEVASGSLWALLREVWAQAWQDWSLGIGLAALAIHARSARNTGPFIALNCGAIPPPYCLSCIR